MLKLLGSFAQLIPLRGLPFKGSLNDDALEIIPDAGILLRDGKILEIDSFDALLKKYRGEIAHVEEFPFKGVLLPGLVDAHTHICWAGSRANDYAARNNGKSYQEIAAQGGGIWQTVQSVRNASSHSLEQTVCTHAESMLRNGVTTIEVKSGYGLSVESELKMLRAIKTAAVSVPQDLIPTCLSAHIAPKDFDGSETAYLESILQDILPIVRSEKLSQRVDIFVEQNAFSSKAAKPFLIEAQKMGFDLTVHADQFSTGGSTLAVAVGAVSADHLEASTALEIKALAKSDVVATVLPGASLGLGIPFAPARKLLDAGACVAIASDWNPGSAPMGDLLVQASLLGAYEKLSFSEVFAGLSFRAAKALNLHDRGQLANGKIADMLLFDTTDYREILYTQGTLKPAHVWKNGVRIL